MKLNPDCVRDILLAVEKRVAFGKWLSFPFMEKRDYEELHPYSQDELNYHIKQCLNFNYLEGTETMGRFTIRDLTPQGHIFIADIRNDTVWNKTKEISKKLGVASLTSLATIAMNVVSELVNKNIF